MHRLGILGLLLVFANVVVIPAQEAPAGPEQQHASTPLSDDSGIQTIIPRLSGRAVILEINARIIEQNETIWTESHRKPTIPGRPVGIKLVGSNIVVAAHFTPYIRRRAAQKFLVAQGQVWMDIPGQGIRYHTSMQTIPLEFGEPIYFFPLGPTTDSSAASIEVMLIMHPYAEEP